MLIDVSTMNHPKAFDLVTIGHFAIDTITSPRIASAKTRLGGPPTYVSVAAAWLGSRVSVISKVGGDFPGEYLEWLQQNKVDLLGLKRVANAETTRFAIEYKDWSRKLRLKARAPSILPSDVPDSLRAKAVHVAPIANEISDEVVARLRKSAKLLSLDPQGFVRSFDEEGNVRLRRWRKPEVLAQTDVFKSSVEEIRVLTGRRGLKQAMRDVSRCGPGIVIVTKGLDGSTLFFGNRFYSVPACRSRFVLDPTGAGDAYMGGFLAEYVGGRDVLWCACVGSAAASFVVEGVGPERFGERHEVYERAHEIYGKVVSVKG